MINSDRLYIDCAKCGGSGQYAPPPVSRGGGGWSQQMPGTCPDCEGVGAIPTADGYRILELVKRFNRYGTLTVPKPR